MRRLAVAVLCITIAGFVPGAAGQSSEMARARALLGQGKAEEAWQLLAPLERRYAGQPDFDFALAVAALESGRPNLATFALERLVVVQPGNAAARLELARAFFALHDYERAEREFGFILGSDPAPAVRSLVARYREAMRLAGAPIVDAGFSGYVEASLGRDSNANVATAPGSIFVPGLGTAVILDPALVRAADNYTSLGAGLAHAHPLAEGFTAHAGADLQLRSYADLDRFDSLAADLHLGLRQRLDARDSVQYTLRHSSLELDHAAYRRMQSVGAEWTRRRGERGRLGLWAQGYRSRYVQEELRASSSNLLAIGASGAYVVDASSRTFAFGGLLLGSDDAVAGRADGDRRIYGARGTLQRRLAQGLDGYAAIALLHSDYRQQNADFGVFRRDRQLDLVLGLSWELAEGWSLRPQVARTRNRSNIELNDYGRTQAEVALRRSWD